MEHRTERHLSPDERVVEARAGAGDAAAPPPRDAGIGVASLDPAGAVAYASPSFLAMWGSAEPDGLCGRAFSELWVPDDALTDACARLGAGEAWRGELVARRASSGTFPAFATIDVVRDDGRRQPQTLVTCEDLTEKREFVAAILASEARYAAAFNDSPDAMIITRIGDGRIVDVNETFEAITGYARAEVLGKSTVELRLWPDNETRDRIVSELRRNRAVKDLEFLFRGAGGSSLPSLYSASVIDIGGEPHVVSLIRDLSAQKAVEATLRASEQRLDEVATQSRTWAWEVDADGLYTYASHVVRDVLGYEPADLVGRRHFYDLHPPDARDEFMDAAFAVFARREPLVDLENLAQAADGSPVWVSTNGVPVTGADGALLGYRGSDTDITGRRQAEAELRRFRTMVDRANYGAALAAGDGTLTYVNDTMAAMHGWTVDELVGRHLSVCHSPGQLERVRDLLTLLARDGAFSSEEVWHVRRDGTAFPTLMNAIVIEGSEGEPAVQSVTMLDISDLKLAEGEIRALNADLERRVRESTADLRAANAELEAFSYSVSHDLRQPLRAIDGFCAILGQEQDRLDDDGRECLERVRAAAQKMARLIDDLLSLSRLSRREIRLTAVDLSALAGEILARLREAEPARRVESSVAPGCVVLTDAGLLEVLLDNLLRNAWKFTGTRDVAHIELGTTEDDGLRVFCVRDDGAGFDAEYADKLFRPFSRLHREDEFPGHGIGLATVQRVVSRLGGRCWAEGAVDRGAAFFFTLGTPPS